MDETREPLVAQSCLVFDFARGAIATRDGVVIGSVQWVANERSRGMSLGYLNLSGEPEWWLTLQGLVAWADDIVQWPNGELIGKVGPHGVRTGRTAVAKIKQQREGLFYKKEWRVAGTAGHLADIVLLKDLPGEQWRLDLRPAAEGPLRYLAATVPALCSRWHNNPW
jgi:hypothetical protein